MNRDMRLLIAMLLFAGALIAGLVQAVIASLYIWSIVMDGGAGFAELFSVEFPREEAMRDGMVCFDFCAPALPLVAGWIGIAAFLGGWFILAHAWWKPKAYKDPAS